MRYLKKYIRKLYHLIWFLSVFFIVSLPVNADGRVTIDGANFTQAGFADFADNTNGYLTRTYSTWVDYGSYYRSNSAILTTGGNTYGANWIFYSDVPFVEGYTYSVTVLIGMANTYPKASSTKVCIAENLTNAIARYNQGFPCTNATVTYANGTTSFDADGVQMYYGVLSYIFTAEFTANAITGSYNSGVSNESNHTFGGYITQLLSDNKQLTQQQITSAVQSSGLATASSVQQVQSSINQVQQQLSGVQDSIDDVNDTLNDSSVDSSDSTINSLKNQLPTNSVISDLMLLPVSMLSSLVNAIDGSCATFSLGSLYGTNLYMPCIDIEDYVGSAIWTFIDLVFSAMFILVIRKTFLKIFHNITNLRTGANEVD